MRVVRAPAAAAVFSSPLSPPPAVPPDDVRLVLLEENRRLRLDVEQGKVAVRSLASIAVALVREIHGHEGPIDREINLPREQLEKLASAEVAVRQEADGSVNVRVTDQSDHPVWESR